MKREFDVVVIGAGPAGMSAAIGLRAQGLTVLVVDEQPAPGGQIWRAVEAVAATPTGRLLGDEYRAGAGLAERFRACGAFYEPDTQVWQIEPDWHVYMTRQGRAEVVRAGRVVLALGAQERPAPFPGWTLPGVLTVGAAQILLKTSRQVPAEPVWVAGSGPLPLLYMAQLLRAGGKVAGWLDTSPPGGWRRALPWLGDALSAWGDVSKGLAWLREIRAAGVKRVRGVTALRALGDDRLREIEYTAGGVTARAPASVLLSHEGVVPSIHMTRALECAHSWNAQQACLAPDLDAWGADQPARHLRGRRRRRHRRRAGRLRARRTGGGGRRAARRPPGAARRRRAGRAAARAPGRTAAAAADAGRAVSAARRHLRAVR